jgi:hypothetical protein
MAKRKKQNLKDLTIGGGSPSRAKTDLEFFIYFLFCQGVNKPSHSYPPWGGSATPNRSSHPHGGQGGGSTTNLFFFIFSKKN